MRLLLTRLLPEYAWQQTSMSVANNLQIIDVLCTWWYWLCLKYKRSADLSDIKLNKNSSLKTTGNASYDFHLYFGCPSNSRVSCFEFYYVGGRGASEFHTFANIQILNGRARLEHMSACLFDVVVEHSETPQKEIFVIHFYDSELYT